MRPVFSVVMPTYGVEKYIEKAIRSVQAQTFENWELLVIKVQRLPAKLQKQILVSASYITK